MGELPQPIAFGEAVGIGKGDDLAGAGLHAGISCRSVSALPFMHDPHRVLSSQFQGSIVRAAGAISDPALLANPFVVPILEDMLGADLLLQYVSSDTCVPGAMLQAPHSDIERHGIFADNRWRPRGFIVNVPLMQCGVHNGSLEVWPGGSHLWGSDLLGSSGLTLDLQDNRNPPVERVAEYFPSLTLALQPGEILIRDLAMWHRGTPNPSDQPRTMFTLGYFRRDYTYGYADVFYNVDEALFRHLHPRIQKMYAPYFSLRSRLGRRQRRLRSAAKRTALSWLSGRSRGEG